MIEFKKIYTNAEVMCFSFLIKKEREIHTKMEKGRLKKTKKLRYKLNTHEECTHKGVREAAGV